MDAICKASKNIGPTLAILLIFSQFISGTASARPDIRKMTCAQAQDTILRNGQIVMTTGNHTYERFVATRQFCDSFEELRPRWYATADTQKCRLNYVCEQRIKRFR